MLPDVVAEDGVAALRDGVVLVGRGDDGELAALEDEPAPAGAELLGGGLVELLLEGLEVAEVGLDLLAIAPEGSPPPLGFMICQNMVWLTWPPPLLRTTVRTSSGTALRSLRSSSAVFLPRSGCFSIAPLRLVT